MPVPPKDLTLVRLALVTFTPKPNGWREWAITLDGIEVSPASAYESEQSLKLLVRAATVLDYRPKVTAEGEVVVPSNRREAAERATELAANLIAVAQGCRRQIASPWPPVVFVATGEEGRVWLAERSGLRHGRLKGVFRTNEQLDLDGSVLNQLRDREDGVALMVEALAHDHAMAVSTSSYESSKGRLPSRPSSSAVPWRHSSTLDSAMTETN